MKSVKAINSIKVFIMTALLGAVAGVVIWLFLKGVSVCTELVWEELPKATGNKYFTIGVCAAGGLIVGILHKISGDYPEELNVVMDKIKKEKHYEYKHMLCLLLCAFIPLVFGASVGPEAGLTGIIAALCYWVGDNVTFAKQHTEIFSKVGEAVALGQIFHSPLFGIIAVEEEKEDEEVKPLQKGEKLVYYGISTAVSFGVIALLNSFFGKAMAGFPSFSELSIDKSDYLMLLVYIPAGLILFVLFECCEKITGWIGKRIPVILKETICGIIIGVTGVFFPIVLFSGEEEMADLMTTFGKYTPLFLIIVCLIKILMTSVCIKLGLKGGHFFPLIFACACMGYALAMYVFGDASAHVVFAAGIVTATTLGAQLKKPIAVALLLLLCFPVRFIFWLFLGAAIGSGVSSVFPKRSVNGDGA